MFGGFEIILIMVMFLVLLPVALALFAFWIWMLISAIQNRGLTDNEKIVWVLVIVLLHWLGALLYFFIGHPKRNVPPPPSPPQTP
jgi:uncharacterized RDD family membrane protein YckC